MIAFKKILVDQIQFEKLESTFYLCFKFNNSHLSFETTKESILDNFLKSKKCLLELDKAIYSYFLESFASHRPMYYFKSKTN